METPKFKRMKAYVVRQSNNLDVKIDQEELDRVVSGIASGQPIVCKQGIVNPSFFIGIILDKDRVEDLHRELGYQDGFGGERAKIHGMKPLSNIFAGTKIGLQLEAGIQKAVAEIEAEEARKALPEAHNQLPS